MKPAPFAYVCADSAEEVVDVLAEYGDDARVLAGGQSLLPMLSMRLARPEVLIDITRIGQLAGHRVEDGALRIGAGVRQSAIERDRDALVAVPLLSSVLPWLGHWQTRSRGTVVGSIAHADPSAELPMSMVALGGTVHLRSATRARTVAAGDFFTGTMQTDMGDDEFIEGVNFPVANADQRTAFAEVGRRHGDFAIVACAAVSDSKGVWLTVGGVNDTPVRQRVDDEALANPVEWLNELAWSLDVRGDNHATPRLRRELVRSLGSSVLKEVSE